MAKPDAVFIYIGTYPDADRLHPARHVRHTAGVFGDHRRQRRPAGGGQRLQVRPPCQHRLRRRQRPTEGVLHVRERPAGQRDQPTQETVWLGELAQEAGHDLDWRRASVERKGRRCG